MTEVLQEQVQQDLSAGALLRRAREAAGLHVAALAVSLKVPVRKLEALEEDRYADLGDAVFIRALASSVCRSLKADPQPVLDRLPQSPAPRLVKDTDGLNAPFRAPGDGPAPQWIDRVRQPVPALVIALVVGAVVIAFVPVTHLDEKPVVAAAPAATHAPAPVAIQAPAPASAAAVPVAAVGTASAPAAQAAAQGTDAPAAAAPAAAVASAAAPESPAAADAGGTVVIRAKGDSWVEVVDARGAVAVRKILAAGETAGASGALPLAVTIGKVDMTEVEVRGKKFDMRPVSKDNVARFTVR